MPLAGFYILPALGMLVRKRVGQRRLSWIFYSSSQKSQGKKTNSSCKLEELKTLIFRTKKNSPRQPGKGAERSFLGEFITSGFLQPGH